MKPSFGVSIVMPTYNEGGHIQDLIRDTSRTLSDAGYDKYEIIVADDDSPDLTWQKALETPGTDSARIKILRRMENHGLTASIWDGIQASVYDVIVWMDCDFSHPPEKIPQMLYMLGEGYDVAVNSRYTIGGGEDRAGKGGPLQMFLSKLLNWSTRFMLKPSFSDYTSGFIAVRRYVLNEIGLRGDYGEYFIDFIYRVIKARKYRVCELPYVAVARRSGESKTGTNIMQYAKRGWRYLWTVIKLRITLLF